jgi:hypothetical protein
MTRRRPGRTERAQNRLSWLELREAGGRNQGRDRAGSDNTDAGSSAREKAARSPTVPRRNASGRQGRG